MRIWQPCAIICLYSILQSAAALWSIHSAALLAPALEVFFPRWCFSNWCKCVQVLKVFRFFFFLHSLVCKSWLERWAAPDSPAPRIPSALSTSSMWWAANRKQPYGHLFLSRRDLYVRVLKRIWSCFLSGNNVKQSPSAQPTGLIWIIQDNFRC